MSAAVPVLVVKPGRDKSLRLRHPWLFSGAVARVDGDPAAGETVKIVDSDAAFLAYGAYSPASQIRARVWSFDVTEGIGAQFFERRIERAYAARGALQDAAHTGVYPAPATPACGGEDANGPLGDTWSFVRGLSM